MKEHEIGRFVTRTLTEFDIVRTSQVKRQALEIRQNLKYALSDSVMTC